MSITEYAKLRSVTTETLRHYDRIGLIKAAFRDEKTGMRYYSINIDDDKMGTVMELKQLGLPLDEIKDFFTDRHAAKSIKILKKRKALLDEKIRSLKVIQSVFEKRIVALEKLLDQEYDENKFWIEERPDRKVYFADSRVDNEIALNRQAIVLEKIFTELAPIIVGGRYLYTFRLEDVGKEKIPVKAGLLLDDEQYEDDHVHIIPAGSYACKYVLGYPLNAKLGLDEFLEDCEKNNFEIISEIYKVVIVVMSVTDVAEENVSVIQARVRKKS